MNPASARIENAYAAGFQAFREGFDMGDAALQRTNRQMYAWKAGWLDAQSRWKPGTETPQEYRARFSAHYPPDQCNDWWWAELFEKFYPRRAGVLTQFKVPVEKIICEAKIAKRKADEWATAVQAKRSCWEEEWSKILAPEFYELPVDVRAFVAPHYLWSEDNLPALDSSFLSWGGAPGKTRREFEPYIEPLVDYARQRAMGRRRIWLCDQPEAIVEEALRRYMHDTAPWLALVSEDRIEGTRAETRKYLNDLDSYTWVHDRKASWSYSGHAYGHDVLRRIYG